MATTCPDCESTIPARARRCPGCGVKLARGDTRLLGRLVGPYRLLKAPAKTREGTRYEAEDPGSGRAVEILVRDKAGAAAAVEDTQGEPAEGDDPRLGTVLADTYRLVERIGAGGVGIVYRAWDVRLGRKVALKLLTEVSQLDEQTRERFRSEARVLARVGHPNVVRVYDVGRAGGIDFFAMELLDGPSLADWIGLQAPSAEAWRAALLSPPEALRQRVRWIRDASRAVQEAHDEGVVHRDLKPANLMLDEDEQVRVLDFGLAHVQGEDKTRTRARLGTPRFMAPEQIGDPKRVDGRADVYALGLTLYALLTLQKPFADADEEHVILARVEKGTLTPAQRINPHLPADLATVVAKAVETRPEDRYATASALADDLERWLDHRPIAARPATWIERARKYVRREPVQTLGFLVLLLSLVLVGTVARTASDRATAEAGKVALQHIQAVENRDPIGMGLFAQRLEDLGMQQEAVLYFNRSAKAGNADAMFHLGRLLLRGDPALRDPEEGLRWLRDAASLGHVEARALLESVQAGE